MKWSYTNGKLNVSSDKTDQQYLLKELVEEASRHQAYRKNYFHYSLFFLWFCFSYKVMAVNCHLVLLIISI
ncbi:hypothetical protein N9442_02795 [Gammaproteobacteria bacterium]|nr:hypothetical protein [Gammaproteobacteria bacterium]